MSGGLISRSEALRLGRKRYYTGKPCKRGHVAERFISGGNCVVCNRINDDAFRERNEERFLRIQREKQAAYRNKPGVSQLQRQRAKEYYWANREEILRKVREAKKHLSPSVKAYIRSPKGRAVRLLADIKQRKKAKELGFSLTRKWLEEKLYRGVCEVTGLPFDFSLDHVPGKRNPYAPSVDRIDPSKGYTQENCRVVLWAVNAALGTWGEEEFLKIAEAFVLRSSRLKVA